MKSRCNNPKIINYSNYGGRGITVCERWNDFKNFLADMGERPPGLTIERIDNDKGYSPDNCRWATAKEQNIHQRKQKNNTSGYYGVSWDSDNGKWRAQIKNDYRNINLGRFAEKEDAARAYDEAAIRYHGEIAKLNFPEKGPCM